MKTGFKDRLAVKEGKEMKSPWDFTCPPYDERSSCFVNAGTNYGVGKGQPVGKERVSSDHPAPRGRVNTLETDYVYSGRPSLFETKERE